MSVEAISLARASEDHAAKTPQGIAYIFGERQWTWAAFHDAVLRTVAALRGEGVGAGDRIAFLGQNSDHYVILLQACLRMGVVLAPFNWRLASEEIAHLLGDSGARLVVADREFLSSVLARPSDADAVRVVVTDEPAEGLPSFADWISDRAPDPSGPIGDPGARTALLLYTSGTTGFPKGALLNQGNLVSGFLDAVGTSEDWGIWDHETVVLIATPIFHIGGTGMVTQTLLGGSRTVVLPRPDVEGMVRAISRHRVTKLFAVPALLNMILNDPAAAEADFSSVRHLLYGASPIPLDLLRRSMRKFPNAGFIQLYGATETAGVATWLSADKHHVDGAPKMASCGRPYVGTEIRILNDAGESLPPREIGEISVRSACVMPCYFNNPKASAAVLSDGWYRTGDAGFLDEDGYLYIQDRVKDMIVSGGENIYPAEVERVLANHPAVRDCTVIGVPDDRWGEAAKAIVILRPGMAAGGEDLRAFLRERIAGFKIPKTFDFVEDIPRTPSGKVLKRELRKPYWEGRDRQVA